MPYLKDDEAEFTYNGKTYGRRYFYQEVPDAIADKFQEHPHAGGVQDEPKPRRRRVDEDSAEGSDE